MIEQFGKMRKQARYDELHSFVNFKLCLSGPTLEDFRSYCPITVAKMQKPDAFDKTLNTWLKEACSRLTPSNVKSNGCFKKCLNHIP
jgi:hypothetical protein